MISSRKPMRYWTCFHKPTSKKESSSDVSTHVETVCLLSKLHEAKHHVNVRLDMDEMDLTAADSKATTMSEGERRGNY